MNGSIIVSCLSCSFLLPQLYVSSWQHRAMFHYHKLLFITNLFTSDIYSVPTPLVPQPFCFSSAFSMIIFPRRYRVTHIARRDAVLLLLHLIFIFIIIFVSCEHRHHFILDDMKVTQTKMNKLKDAAIVRDIRSKTHQEKFMRISGKYVYFRLQGPRNEP